MINPNDEDMVRVVEGVLGFYGGCCVLEPRDMAVKVLNAVSAELDRREAREREQQYRYEMARKEQDAILASVRARQATRLMVRGKALGTEEGR